MIPLVPLLFVFYPLQIFTQTKKYIINQQTNKKQHNNKTKRINAISDRGVVSVGCKPSKQNRKVNKAMMHQNNFYFARMRSNNLTA